MKILTDVDLNNNELLNSVIHYSLTPPVSPVAGQVWTRSSDNIEFRYTGSKWLSTTWIRSGAGRNSATTSDSYLRGYNGAATNVAPYVVPMDATLVKMSMNSRDLETWTVELRNNGGAGTKFTELLCTNLDFITSDFDIDMNSGTKIRFYCSGTNISYPRADIYFRWRVD